MLVNCHSEKSSWIWPSRYGSGQPAVTCGERYRSGRDGPSLLNGSPCFEPLTRHPLLERRDQPTLGERHNKEPLKPLPAPAVILCPFDKGIEILLPRARQLTDDLEARHQPRL